MTLSKSVVTFISDQRQLLDRLERFAGTPEYGQLLATIGSMAVGDLEPWFAQWLIQPSVGLRELPIDALMRPEGLKLVEEHLVQIACFNG